MSDGSVRARLDYGRVSLKAFFRLRDSHGCLKGYSKVFSGEH